MEDNNIMSIISPIYDKTIPLVTTWPENYLKVNQQFIDIEYNSGLFNLFFENKYTLDGQLVT